jgi:Glycine/sarcosine/betaine reductase selenoprotein B (GRDB)
MAVFENVDKWREDFRGGWLKHLEQTGKINWKLYHHARNRQSITGRGVNPKKARLLLVTTSGAYLSESQAPFDAASTYGDYSIRTFGANSLFTELDYAHEHYDHTARKRDPQVNLPLRYLAKLVSDGEIGAMADKVVSFSGYHPDAGAVVEKLIPEIQQVATETQATAALLIPV